jgi:hypothetical protein
MESTATATVSNMASGPGASSVNTSRTTHHHETQTQQQQQRSGKSSGAKRTSTREKIEKMVAEGTSNYPAYLKLIYTGDSEDPSSSDDELSLSDRTRYQPRPHAAAGPRIPAAGAGSRDLESTRLSDSVREKCRLTGMTSLPAAESVRTRGPAAATSSAATSSRPQVPDNRQQQQQHDRIVGDDVNNTSSSRDEDEFDRRQQTSPLEAATQQQQQQQSYSIEDEAALRLELYQMQDNIVTLKSVLNSKLTEAASLRQKLGLTAMAEIRHDLQNGLNSIKQSGTFQKTNAAFKSFSAYAYRKMGNLRQSVSFRSVGEQVGSIRTSRSMGSFKSRLTMLSTSKSDGNVAAATHTIGDDDDSDDEDEDDEDYVDDRSTHSQPEM